MINTDNQKLREQLAALDKDKKAHDSHWYDINRVEVLPGSRVMDAPNVDSYDEDIFAHNSGPAEKPNYKN